MTTSRRGFMAVAGALPLLNATEALQPRTNPVLDPGRFEPWIDVESAALKANVDVLSRLAGGRPIIAMIKNNGYGLGLREVARALEPDRRISGFGVVKVSEAIALREAGIRKPVLLLAIFGDSEGEALVRHGITLAISTPDAAARIERATARSRRPARAQLYIDTGMSRMGLPYHAALPMIQAAARTPRLTLDGMLTELTEDRAFDTEQVQRLAALARQVQGAGVNVGGPLHAASSHAVFNHADTLLDAVRPGISLFGAYPTDDGREKAIATLRVAFSLRARVARVERLRPGDTVSYGRRYTAAAPTWVATIPVGHADGYPRRAVAGGRILIGDRTCPVIGAVSASHAIVELGPDTNVKVGDVATLLGPGHDDIHPNVLAGATGISVYDVLMHLSPTLPRIVR